MVITPQGSCIGPDFAQWQISSFWIQTWPQQQMLRCAMRKTYIIMCIYIYTLIFILWFYVYCLGISCLALSIESYVYKVYASLRSIIFWTIPKTPGWWFYPSWKILVNGKDYPIYYGKYKMFETTNQTRCPFVVRMLNPGWLDWRVDPDNFPK